MSPWRLPGEPNRASAVWLAAGDQTSLGGVSRLFSRSSLVTSYTYNIEKEEMQGENPRFSKGKAGCQDEKPFDSLPRIVYHWEPVLLTAVTILSIPSRIRYIPMIRPKERREAAGSNSIRKPRIRPRILITREK